MLAYIVCTYKDMQMKTKCLLLSLFFFCLMMQPTGALGGSVFKIALLMGPEGETPYHHRVIEEINTLLENRTEVTYQKVVIGTDWGPRARDSVTRLMSDNSVDCIIGIGIEQSELLVQLKHYEKPTIAATILDRRLQGLHLTAEGASGIRNFNYIQSPFDIVKDLKAFKSLYDFNHLAVLAPTGETIMFHTIYSYFGKAVKTVSPEARLSMVEFDINRIEESIAEIPPDADAVYVLPLIPAEQTERVGALIRSVNAMGLPSFAMAGERYVHMGAMASIAPEQNFNAMTRRVAINVLEILDGRDAGTLPVTVSAYSDNFVANVETFRRINYYPGFKALEEARLLNLDKLRQGPSVNLKGIIFEALEKNLDLQIERADTEIQSADADIAGSALLPQVSLSTSITQVDENRVEIAGTAAARTTWSVSGSVSQSIFTDDLLANHAIQKILTESQRFQEQGVLLDTVLSAVEAYITLLSALSNQGIQNNNLEVTRKNLDIARNKAAVGTVDSSEVNRWESEKANNQIRLNDAHRDVQIARMALNQVLNSPISREFSPEDVQPDASIELLVTDPEVYQLVGNFKQLERFSNFLVREADQNLPELKQVAQSLRSEERRLLNRKRAMYLPDVNLSANIDKILEERDAVTKTPSDLDHPWTVALTATWPLYTGGADKKALSKSRIQLRRIRMEERDLRNRLHFSVRSNLETAAVSAREIDLAERAKGAAKKSFEIVQAGYAEGRNSVTDLVDAQNAMVASEQNAALSKYQFVIDFITLERAIGRYHFLDSPEAKQSFLTRLRQHMKDQPTDN